MESQPRNPEFSNNPENVHPCNVLVSGPEVQEGILFKYISYL